MKLFNSDINLNKDFYVIEEVLFIFNFEGFEDMVESFLNDEF